MDKRIFNAFSPIRFPNWKYAPVVLLAISPALFLTACGDSKAASDNTNANASNQPKTVNTKIVAASVQEVPKFIEATGTFQADESTDVAAETSGKVTQTPAPCCGWSKTAKGFCLTKT